MRCDGEPVLGSVVEVQLRRSARKRFTGPAYVASLRARIRATARGNDQDTLTPVSTKPGQVHPEQDRIGDGAGTHETGRFHAGMGRAELLHSLCVPSPSSVHVPSAWSKNGDVRHRQYLCALWPFSISVKGFRLESCTMIFDMT